MGQPPAIAIILARRGSKGVPGKNVAPVAGRPCIEWTLDAAIAAESVGRIVVSSDDPRVHAIVRRAGPGVELVKRPRALAADRATVDDAARHALESIEARDGKPFAPGTPVVILYANVPVRPWGGGGLIDRAVRLLRRTRADSVQSYAPVGKHHPWWIARVDERSGRVKPWEGRVLNHGVYRRQDLPPAFIPDGGVLVVTRRALRLEVPGVALGPHAFFGSDRRGIVSPEGGVIDIDAPVDLLVADAMLRGLGGVGSAGVGGKRA
jgi:CMP-N,N'-diacetyllegionaminic acid synthase